MDGRRAGAPRALPVDLGVRTRALVTVVRTSSSARDCDKQCFVERPRSSRPGLECLQAHPHSAADQGACGHECHLCSLQDCVRACRIGQDGHHCTGRCRPKRSRGPPLGPHSRQRAAARIPSGAICPTVAMGGESFGVLVCGSCGCVVEPPPSPTSFVSHFVFRVMPPTALQFP